MAFSDDSSVANGTRPPLYVGTDPSASADAFVDDFTIGRDADCALTIDSGLVSRLHARVAFRDGHWHVDDAGSTNGLYVDGDRTETVRLDRPTTLRFGLNGPRLHLRPAEQTPSAPTDPTTADAAPSGDSPDAAPSASDAAPSPERPPSPAGPNGQRSVTSYYEYYFQGADAPDADRVGEHTRLVRQAYQRAQQADRSRFLIVIAGILGVCLLLAGVALWQYQQRAALEGQAEQVFLDLKRQDLALAELRRATEGQPPSADRAAIAQRREELAARYGGYVQELGLRRQLSAEEQIIHRVARIFGESEFSMPAGFVREVRETIQDYWLGPGRTRYVNAVERAQDNGYVDLIVDEMLQHGLPPEFFYLALQESDFRTDAVGPRTRWGIAKGMWQFIPSTGRRYGLTIGPREGDRVVDPADDRHDAEASTGAAARYLKTIYTTEAQASGLLVIASYNWGEHRVNNKLNRMRGLPETAFAGIPEDPSERNYWRFLTTYRDRMPQETRDYVLRVFAAAVIGQDPQHFGLEMDNPLQAAIESTAAPLPAPSPSPDS